MRKKRGREREGANEKSPQAIAHRSSYNTMATLNTLSLQANIRNITKQLKFCSFFKQTKQTKNHIYFPF